MARLRKNPLPTRKDALVSTPCRLPLWLHKAISQEAARNRRSRNGEIIKRLELSVATTKQLEPAE